MQSFNFAVFIAFCLSLLLF